MSPDCGLLEMPFKAFLQSGIDSSRIHIAKRIFLLQFLHAESEISICFPSPLSHLQSGIREATNIFLRKRLSEISHRCRALPHRISKYSIVRFLSPPKPFPFHTLGGCRRRPRRFYEKNPTILRYVPQNKIQR